MNLLGAKSPLTRLKHQRRFITQAHRILLVRDSYHIESECRSALIELGHEVVDVWMPPHPTADAMLKAILNAAVVWRPDALVSINAFGFDRACWLAEAIEAMGLPTAIWWVDSPFLVLRGWLPLTSETMHHFVWDRAYMAALKRLGVQHVHHLPLAASKNRRRPPLADTEKLQSVRFVGNSLSQAPNFWARPLTAQQRSQAEAWLPRVEQRPEALLEMNPQPNPPVCMEVMAQGFVQAEISRRRRHGALFRINHVPLEIFGDPGWEQAKVGGRRAGQVTYGAPLDDIYREAALTLNVTSAQMPGGVNQRVFDVPHCGAFLLSDRQAELADYFDPKEEMATFDSQESLACLVSQWLAHPAARQEMILRAQRRIDAEHLFSHRLSRLIEQLRCTHGPLRFRRHKTIKTSQLSVS